MKSKEFEFLKEKTLNLLTRNKSININSIIDYMDYINKVKYSKDEIEPILSELILENKISLKNGVYVLSYE